MLSESQDKKYWRRWAAVVRANRWRMCGGRLAREAVLDASEHHCSVAAAARQLAEAEAKGLTPDHLRHACHIVALGHDKSHARFTNKEFDSLLNYWGDERAIRGLLIEPTDLAATIHESNPDLKLRERMLIVIRRDFVESYVAALSDSMFETKDWQSLPDTELTALYHIIQDRPNARRGSHERKYDPTNAPF